MPTGSTTVTINSDLWMALVCSIPYRYSKATGMWVAECGAKQGRGIDIKVMFFAFIIYIVSYDMCFEDCLLFCLELDDKV